MSSSGGSSAISMPLLPETGPLSLSTREERNRTVEAVISNDEPEVPSCFVQILGPPVDGSALMRPSTRTCWPFLRYWLQISACLPHAVPRNQMVFFTFSPFALV